MQLAATQRAAHPPPVPPRPNRQALIQPGVVATKKRPPCPTRQAPPPPSNARPWNNHANNINNNNNVISNGLSNGCGAKKQLEVRFEDAPVVVKVREDQEDPNIKRQDWLEAGVRYSSTKITLPANGCEKVGSNGGFPESEEVAEAEAETAEEDAEEKEDEGGGEEATAAENQPEFGDLDFSR